MWRCSNRWSAVGLCIYTKSNFGSLFSLGSWLLLAVILWLKVSLRHWISSVVSNFSQSPESALVISVSLPVAVRGQGGLSNCACPRAPGLMSHNKGCPDGENEAVWVCVCVCVHLQYNKFVLLLWMLYFIINFWSRQVSCTYVCVCLGG